MSRTEYDPTPHAQDVPHVQDATIPPPAPLSEDSEQRHALAAFVHVTLAVQARAMHRARVTCTGGPRCPRGSGGGSTPRPPGGDPHAGRAGLGGQAPPGGLCGAPARLSVVARLDPYGSGSRVRRGVVRLAPLVRSGSSPLRCQRACCCCHGASAACARSQRSRVHVESCHFTPRSSSLSHPAWPSICVARSTKRASSESAAFGAGVQASGTRRRSGPYR
jgi:hypothetical protein